jgi:hypothetical protein
MKLKTLQKAIENWSGEKDEYYEDLLEAIKDVDKFNTDVAHLIVYKRDDEIELYPFNN